MYFDSITDFLHMGGHGYYVWLCWVLVMVTLVFGVLYVRQERKKLLKKLSQAQLRQNKIRTAKIATPK